MMNLQRMADATGLSLPECRAGRIEYLTRHIKELAEDVAWLADDSGELSYHFCRPVFAVLVIEARELRHLARLAKGYAPRAGTITPEMIGVARDHPVEQLIEFDRQGKSLSWCHADKTPSLSWDRKRNRATCFPCGKSYNSIDVLTQRDGMSFRDAVRQLTS